MQVRRSTIVRVGEKEAEFDTLFDPGSTVTLTGYAALKKLLGEVPVRKLAKARWVVLADGNRVSVDGYVDAEIAIDEYMIEERIYLSRDVVREAVIEGRKVKLPDLVIGAPTMESWGIELDLKKGDVRSCREGFVLL